MDLSLEISLLDNQLELFSPIMVILHSPDPEDN